MQYKKFNKNNSGQFGLLLSTKFTWMHVIKILLSTYTNTAIFDCTFNFTTFFHSGYFEQGRTFFLQPGGFGVYITSFCNLTCFFL